MTNEEKAREISVKRIISEQNNITGELAIRYAHDACIDMSQWKDEQLAAEKQSLIEKACEWVKRNVYRYLESYGPESGDVCIDRASLINDFRKAMEATK